MVRSEHLSLNRVLYCLLLMMLILAVLLPLLLRVILQNLLLVEVMAEFAFGKAIYFIYKVFLGQLIKTVKRYWFR